nr:hypothetical protein [Tanacetum cinerariifolium]
QVNTAKPKAVINVVRTNQVNDVKASACWVWKPIKPNSASITLKRYDYVDVRGKSRKNPKNLNIKISKLNEELSDCETDLYNYKSGLSQVEARLVEFIENEVKYCKRIRVLERDVEIRDNKIEYLKDELDQIKKEKESLDNKLTGFENASKDLDNLLGSQRSYKNKEGLGYSAVPPPPAQIYSPPKKDLSWIGSIMSKLMIKFVKEADCPRQVNTARPKAVINAVRMNQVNDVKASSSWVGNLSNLIVNQSL